MWKYFLKIHFVKISSFTFFRYLFILCHSIDNLHRKCLCNHFAVKVFAKNETLIFPLLLALLSIIFIQFSSFYYFKPVNCFSLCPFSWVHAVIPFRSPSSIKRLQTHLNLSGFQINAVVFLFVCYLLFQALFSIRNYLVATVSLWNNYTYNEDHLEDTENKLMPSRGKTDILIYVPLVWLYIYAQIMPSSKIHCRNTELN